jgi:surface protein
MNSAFQILSSLKSLDLSKWNVRKVKTMRMMFQGHGGAYGPSGLVSVGDLSGWATESLEDVSYMCSYCENLAELDITGFDVSKVTKENGMQRTFYHCGLLRELDFSNWNNKDAASSLDMLSYTPLEKITIGKNFRFNGFSLPASDESKIPLADGNWYDIDGTAYTSDRVAAANVARTYYASKFVIEGEDKTRVFVTAGLLKQMAMAARSKSGKEDLLKPADALRLLALETDT